MTSPSRAQLLFHLLRRLPWRLVAACAVLALFAARYWGWIIDDAAITLGYAAEWVERGRVQWTSGVQVEGYSSPLHLALVALGLATGLDGFWALRVTTLGGALACLALAHRWLPRSLHGTVLLLLLAAWPPLAFWSMAGLETPVYAAVLAAGWGLTVSGDWREWRWGAGLLLVAAVLRPEAALYALFAALLRARVGRPLGRGDLPVVAAALALVAYHALRIAAFGEVMPTPFLVKIQSVAGLLPGAQQLAADLLLSSGLLAGVALGLRLPAGSALLALVPLAVQGALLFRAGGDWMGHGRFLLPGVFASVLAWSRLGVPVVERRSALLCVLLGIPPLWFHSGGPGGALTASVVGDGRLVRADDLRLVEGGFHSDVRWLVQHLPWGATFESTDVGLVGHVPGARLTSDPMGLVDRPMAEYRRGDRSAALLERLEARYRPGPEQLACVRAVSHACGQEPAVMSPAHLDAFVLRESYDLPWPCARVQWHCRPGLPEPSPFDQWLRWDGLSRRLPYEAFARERDAVAPWLPRWAFDPRTVEGLGWDDRTGWAAPGGHRLSTWPLPRRAWARSELVLEGRGAAELRFVPECAPARTFAVEGRVALAPGVPECLDERQEARLELRVQAGDGLTVRLSPR